MTDRVLFVDDEPYVLDAIRRVTRKDFDASFANSGSEAIDILNQTGSDEFAVLCTDMRMPGVDGVGVLRAFKDAAPDTVRILLTGQADIDAAVSAVNEGSVFRFLLKPTNPNALCDAILQALEMHRLRCAERELLEDTLRGSVEALVDTLALANPTAFARAVRLREITTGLLPHLPVENAWEIQVAVMLSQVGMVTLPQETVDRIYNAEALTETEQAMLAEVPDLAVHLIAAIPRMENVALMLQRQSQWQRPDAPLGTKVLRLAEEIDFLTKKKANEAQLMATLKQEMDSYGSELVAAAASYLSQRVAEYVIRKIPLRDLITGMVLANDVFTCDGLLLVGANQEVSTSLKARLMNYHRTFGLAEDEVEVYENSSRVR